MTEYGESGVSKTSTYYSLSHLLVVVPYHEPSLNVGTAHQHTLYSEYQKSVRFFREIMNEK